MKLPRLSAALSLSRSSAVPRHPGATRRSVVPSVVIRRDALTGRGWNCGAAGGGHAGYSCFSHAGYPHLSVVGATRRFILGPTEAQSYDELEFDRFHFSPNAPTSHYYREFAPGRWEPEGAENFQAQVWAGPFIRDVLGGELYGLGAGALAAQPGGQVLYG